MVNQIAAALRAGDPKITDEQIMAVFNDLLDLADQMGVARAGASGEHG